MEENNIIELIDDATGESVSFEHLATIEHNGAYYIALTEIAEDEDDTGECEVIIMRIDQDDEGNECYVQVEDEDEQQTVFDKFIALMEEEEEE